MRKIFFLIISLSLFLVSNPAFGQADFTDTVTFGNSLTHNDFLGPMHGLPQDMYGMDPSEAVFVKGAILGDQLSNYAVAGSQSGHVSAQIDLYELYRFLGFQDKATLIGFEIGSNDVLNNIYLLAASPPGVDPNADAVINNIINNIAQDLTRLYNTHLDAQFIIWLIPDVTVTPDLWNDLTPTEIENVLAHIERVNRRLRAAGARFNFMVAFDTCTMLQEAVADPPVIFGQQLVPPPAHGDYDHIFADTVHPTAVSNALFANEIITRINEDWNDTIPFYTEEELADLAHIPY
jgi:phospholipase/lecithinase/hemolysin